MVRFARNSDQDIADVLRDLGDEPTWDGHSDNTLYPVHDRLKKLVRPATPRGIIEVENGLKSKSPWRHLGPVPLVRWLIAAAVLSLAATAAFFAAEPDFLKEGFEGTTGATGEKESVNTAFAVMFVISAAGLGASFYTLFTSFRYVNNRSYDTARDSTYLARFVLGLVGGLILALVLFGTDQDLGVSTVGLAIVGGFSADIVFRILTRLAQTTEFLILGERNQNGNRAT